MARFHHQFWRATPGASLSAGFSTVAHLVLVSTWVVVTLPAVRERYASPDTRVSYFPPPDPRPASRGSVETIQYVALAPEGPGAGMGLASEGAGVELDIGRPRDTSVGDAGRDSTSSAESVESNGADSVFTIIQVDTAAARLPESAAPRYPADLLERRIEGQAIVQFVVDTTGLADPASFVVVVASHPGFAQSVREALPGMRFSTARIGNVKVRQLVELPFAFAIAEPAPPADSTASRTTRRRPQ